MSCTFCFTLGWLTEFVTLRFVRLVADMGVWMLLIFHVCCLLSCHQNSRSVPIVRHSNTDLPAHHKLTPIAILSELSKLLMMSHKPWRLGSANRVTRTCCGKRFSVRNRACTAHCGTATNRSRITQRLGAWITKVMTKLFQRTCR
jgi:hypothetical protein